MLNPAIRKLLERTWNSFLLGWTRITSGLFDWERGISCGLIHYLGKDGVSVGGGGVQGVEFECNCVVDLGY